MLSGAQLCVKERRLPYRLLQLLENVKYCSLTNPFLSVKLMYASLGSTEARCRGLMLQIHGKTLLRDMLTACHTLHIDPFLAWGCLLGHFRQGRLIEHDHDIDLGLLPKDFKRKDALGEMMKKRGYAIRRTNNFNISFHKIGLPKIHIDIDLYYEKNDKMAYSILWKGQLFTYFFPLETFSKLRKIRFLNRFDVLIPHLPEMFLDYAYGDWRTPKESWDFLHDPPNLGLVEKVPPQ